MAIPNLPPFYNMTYTDKDGNLTSDAHLYNDQTFQVLNEILLLVNSISTTVVSGGSVTLNGLNPPSFTTAEIAALAPSVSEGTIWYDKTLGKLKFKNSAGIQTITSTP